jgi:curli biogenesis system outer membrane secretion channel CsgG
MTRRRYPLPIAALACVALLAGCGSSSTSSTSTASSSPAQTGSTAAKTTTSPAPPVPTGSAEVKAAITECKQIIQEQSKLPSGAKEKLEGACAKAANGDTNAVKVAAREVCEEVIDKSAVPGGSAKEEALKACRK